MKYNSNPAKIAAKMEKLLNESMGEEPLGTSPTPEIPVEATPAPRQTTKPKIAGNLDDLSSESLDMTAQQIINDKSEWEGSAFSSDRGDLQFHGAHEWYSVPKRVLDEYCMSTGGEHFNPEFGSDQLSDLTGSGSAQIHSGDEFDTSMKNVSYSWKIGDVKELGPEMYAVLVSVT